jgi:hypothetical protein
VLQQISENYDRWPQACSFVLAGKAHEKITGTTLLIRMVQQTKKQ